MGTYELRPHTNRYEIGGRRHDFQSPLFLAKLSSRGEKGLYMAVRDHTRPEERIYLHMPLSYVVQIMAGWISEGDVGQAIEAMLAFAKQNIHQFQHFVINIEPDDLDGEGYVTKLRGLELRIIKLKMPEKIELLDGEAHY